MNNIERKIFEIYKKVYKKVFSQRVLRKMQNGSLLEVELAVKSLENNQKYKDLAQKLSLELTKMGLNKTKSIWRKYYEKAKQSHYVVLPKTFTEYEKQMMKKSVNKNFEMIKNLPSRMNELAHQKNVQTLIEEVAKGNLPRGSFQKKLETEVGLKRAKVIARTETAKLQTAIEEDNSRSLGAKCYEWVASSDQRTRPSHKAMDGVIVFWRDNELEKPLLDNMYGNAGEFPNCRCSMISIFSKEDLTKSNYKVYNYHTTKVVTVSKNQLLKWIEQGGI